MKKKTFKLATLGCRTNQYEPSAFSTIEENLPEFKIENFLEVEFLGKTLRSNEIKEVFIQDNTKERLVGVVL